MGISGISPQNMAKNMVLTYLRFRILKFPLKWYTEKFIGWSAKNVKCTIFFTNIYQYQSLPIPVAKSEIKLCLVAHFAATTSPRFEHPLFAQPDRGPHMDMATWTWQVTIPDMVKCHRTNWKITIFHGKIHYKSPFSIGKSTINHHFSWENSLFLWSFSIVMWQFTRG